MAKRVAKVRKPRSRKRARGSPTHVAQLQLRPTPRMRAVIDIRFHASLRVYNACLGEALKRCRKLRTAPRFEQAKEMPQGSERTVMFRILEHEAGFEEQTLMSFGSSLRQSWVRDQVLAQEAQVLARRAFRAAARWHYGKSGKPRFKPAKRGLRSLGCKDLNGPLRVVCQDGVLVGLRWGQGLMIPFAQPKKPSELAEMEGIATLVAVGKLLSCRITRNQVRGRWAYRCQLVMDGAAPVRHHVGNGMVSLDLGPSMAHVVSQTAAQHCSLAPGVTFAAKSLRRQQRKLDRQHRTASPDCFGSDGRHIAGKCHWRERSQSAQRTKAQIAESYRVLAARRDTEHGRLANQLLTIGTNLRTEKLNYVAWQKHFPKSVRDKAPGSFVTKLRHKAASAGGGLYEYNPRTTALSQTCVCGRKAKKPLHQRHHSCECGVEADRDLFSAFLGLFVEPQGGIDTLDAESAKTAYSTRHDLGGVLASRVTAGAVKQRVRWRAHRGHRSVVRITKRLSGRSDRVAQPKPVQSAPTALEIPA